MRGQFFANLGLTRSDAEYWDRKYWSRCASCGSNLRRACTDYRRAWAFPWQVNRRCGNCGHKKQCHKREVAA